MQSDVEIIWIIPCPDGIELRCTACGEGGATDVRGDELDLAPGNGVLFVVQVGLTPAGRGIKPDADVSRIGPGNLLEEDRNDVSTGVYTGGGDLL